MTIERAISPDEEPQAPDDELEWHDDGTFYIDGDSDGVIPIGHSRVTRPGGYQQ